MFYGQSDAQRQTLMEVQQYFRYADSHPTLTQWRTKAMKVNGAKEAMIDEIYERIRAGTFKICWHKNVGCNHLITEWRQYARDDKGLIIKQNDHCMDALFYALAGLSSARSEEQRVRELHGYRGMKHFPTTSGGEWMRY